MIARADRGTLFLDELSSLPVEGQAKLLRVLETGEVLPLGASTKQVIDFRLVAAAHEDIADRVGSELFRRVSFTGWQRCGSTCRHWPHGERTSPCSPSTSHRPTGG